MLNLKPVGILAICAAAATLPTSAFSEDKPWENSLHIGLNLTDGNSDTLLVTGGLTGEGESDDRVTRVGIEGSYGETDGEADTQDARAFANHKRSRNGYYLYADGSFLHDDSADLDYRLVLGPGIGTFLIRDDAARLSVESGVAWVREKKAGEEDDVAALRIGQEYTRDLSDHAKVWQSLEYLPDIKDFDAYLLNAELGLESMLNASMSLRMVVKNRYDNRPAEDRKHNDVIVTASLGYKF